MQSSWLGKNTLKDTHFVVCESGWMTTTIFHDWFEEFIKKVETTTILLVFDCHMTHLSLATVQLAKAENISLVKLTAHCIDVMQPLDVSALSKASTNSCLQNLYIALEGDNNSARLHFAI